MNFDLHKDTVSADDFFSEFNEPVEFFEPPENNPINPKPEENPFSEVLNSTEFAELNQDTSGFLIESAVGVMAYLIAAFVAKTDDTTRYMLPETEVAKIKAIVNRMLPTHKPVMSNTMALITTIGLAYTPLLATAMSDRKEAEYLAEIENLKREIEKNKLNQEPENEAKD